MLKNSNIKKERAKVRKRGRKLSGVGWYVFRSLHTSTWYTLLKRNELKINWKPSEFSGEMSQVFSRYISAPKNVMRLMENDNEMLNSHWGAILPKHILPSMLRYREKLFVFVFTFLFTIFKWQQINEKKVRIKRKKNEMCPMQIECFWVYVCEQFSIWTK